MYYVLHYFIFSVADTKLGIMKMPPAIERSVRKQNIKFMHNKNQFSAEYFQFIRKLVSCNSPPVNRQHSNEKLVSYIVLCFSNSPPVNRQHSNEKLVSYIVLCFMNPV